MATAPPARSPLEELPSPNTIRNRIAQLYAEAKVLRKLLRVAESRDRLQGSAPRTGLEVACVR